MKNILLALVVIGSLTGCLKNGSQNEFTCNYNECAVKAPAAEIEQVKAYLSANNITATEHCSGLLYVIDDPGTGNKPTACSSVLVNYEGRLTNGNTFDKSTSPVAFSLTGVIKGFQNGVPLVKTGGKIRLFIPPSLGYGSTAQNGIPANSILIFDVELLDMR